MTWKGNQLYTLYIFLTFLTSSHTFNLGFFWEESNTTKSENELIEHSQLCVLGVCV